MILSTQQRNLLMTTISVLFPPVAGEGHFQLDIRGRTHHANLP